MFLVGVIPTTRHVVDLSNRLVHLDQLIDSNNVDVLLHQHILEHHVDGKSEWPVEAAREYPFFHRDDTIRVGTTTEKT